ncbi:hypothetical protein FS749_003177 [Ceratobasidium sp. UAMH 11750]|nr:hypothetical protein FS749_003177 [Ceratobasidium sp. UAMH 11750]
MHVARGFLRTILASFGLLRTDLGAFVTRPELTIWASGGEHYTYRPILQTGISLATVFSSTTQATLAPVHHQNPSVLWFACPDSEKTQCAFFEAPRDSSNPTESDTVSIFLRKFPASAAPKDRLGTILTNPGGPGGSGTAWIAVGGEQLSAIVDGRYDIVGFDPRGVNLTGPWTACFDTESEPLLTELRLETQGVPFPRSTFIDDRAVVDKIKDIQARHSKACRKKGNYKMLESVGTAFVAQDMVRIVQALGDDGLNYWGYSYGTILGATFAAMRPDLVKRMVLDSVSNAESYYNDILQWGRDSMDETHKTFTGFLSTCAEAGPEHCAFAVSPSKSNVTQTTKTLRKRLNNIFARLDRHPMVVAGSEFGSGVFTAPGLQKLIFYALYSPATWPGAMQALANVEKGDATDAYTAIYSPFIDTDRYRYDDNVFNRSMQRHITSESFNPIMCGDSAAMNISLNAYTDYFRELGKISPTGEQWASIVGGCNRWSFRARQRYTGPWTVAKGLKKTRFPILFVGMDADPVTPLSSAAKMARGFGNDSAVLLVQQGFGHCTTEHPSLCTYKHIRDYFVDGKVPANGTHCTADPGFIYPTNTTDVRRMASMYDKRDAELLEAVENLREARSQYNLNTLGA